ncbi:MAG: DNA mismatch endonuclease Vsr [Alphaproteobacteria bacterium]
MVDKLTPERRSQNMARIKSRDTKPELAVRRALHRLGYRFRLHRTDLPGRPDITLPRLRTAIFVHGCFWHRHARCRFSYMPKSRIAFWEAKFQRNIVRDRAVRRALRKEGWRVLVIWECQTHDLEGLRRRLQKLLPNRLRAQS